MAHRVVEPSCALDVECVALAAGGRVEGHQCHLNVTVRENKMPRRWAWRSECAISL